MPFVTGSPRPPGGRALTVPLLVLALLASLLALAPQAAAADIPTQEEVSRALDSAPSTNYFWTGRTGKCAGEEDSVKGTAEQLARERGGKTLEMRLREAGVKMPSFDAPDPAKDIWRFASREYARKTSYQAWVIKGTCVRDDNTWEDKEFPNLKSGGQVHCVWEIDAEHPFAEKLIWNDWFWGGTCRKDVHLYNKARVACYVYDRPSSRWDHESLNARTFRDLWFISGTPWRGRRTDRAVDRNAEGFLFSIEPASSLSGDMDKFLHDHDYLLGWFRPGDIRPYRVEVFDSSTTFHREWSEPYDTVCGTGAGSPAAPRGSAELSKRAVTVMPLGDSITAGVGSSTAAGYRAPLYDDLKRAAKSVDFVGSLHTGTMPDGDNEGHPGRRIDQIAKAADCSVPAQRPNVVTLHAGTNDLNQNHDVKAAPARLGSLIDQVLDDDPEATVLVADLVPATKPGLQPLIDAYNAQLPSVVGGFRDRGKHVALLDMSAVTTADLAQPAHPNDTGYRKMADVFLDGIAQAAADGWLEDPRNGTGKGCGSADDDGSKAGPGWEAIGVIAPGMNTCTGRTDLVEINGDGRADYVKVGDDGSVCAAFNTPGADLLHPHWVNPTPGRGLFPPMGPAGFGAGVRFADVTGDGRDEYLYVSPEGAVTAWLNDGRQGDDDQHPYFGRNLGVIAPGVRGATREQIRFADINGDRRADFLRVTETGAVDAYVNTPDSDGTIHWKEWLNWAGGVQGGSRDKLRLADVNGDRKDDYLIVGSTGAVHAYINNGGGGAGSFIKEMYFVNETGYPGDKTTFRDVDGDGKADYVVIYDGGAIRAWHNRGGNTG
ncbi:GDSL-type esterase/lipase family protein [Streptomyces virginiae]|uniref:GDSL-type esterase/lipase family protein n=1 Tax=Streptomyces virginiae TaxID=1961 RepID=A0ABZ1TMP7_STRVG|nr:GDSL-type esterase/lipase family protein [Streptomyces virginiae]